MPAAQPLQAGAAPRRWSRVSTISRRPGRAASPGRPAGRRRAGRRARSALPCAAIGPMSPRQERKLGLQRLRPLQDRGRSIQFAHDGTDDGRLPLCRGAAWRRAARADRAGRGRPLRLARPDRQGPRHRPRDPARPVGRAAGPDRSRRRRPDGRPDPRERPDQPRRTRTRSPSTRRRTCASSSASGCRIIQQRHALHRLRRRPAPTLDSARLLFGRRRRRGRRGGGGAQRPARGRLGRAPPLQLGRPAARHRRARGHRHRRHRPRQRARRR